MSQDYYDDSAAGSYYDDSLSDGEVAAKQLGFHNPSSSSSDDPARSKVTFREVSGPPDEFTDCYFSDDIYLTESEGASELPNSPKLINTLRVKEEGPISSHKLSQEVSGKSDDSDSFSNSQSSSSSPGRGGSDDQLPDCVKCGRLRREREHWRDMAQGSAAENAKLKMEMAEIDFAGRSPTGTLASQSEYGADLDMEDLGKKSYIELLEVCSRLKVEKSGVDSDLRALQINIEIAAEEKKGLEAQVVKLLGDIELDEKRRDKKKNWYGGKKKSKTSEAAKSAQEVRNEHQGSDLVLHVPTPVSKQLKPKSKKERWDEEQRRMLGEMATLKREVEKRDTELRHATEKRITIEKSNAKLEAEVMILTRSVVDDRERLGKATAHLDMLKNQQRHEATSRALDMTRAIEFPFPKSSEETEKSRLLMANTMLENSLKRMTIQRDQLQDMMETWEASHGALYKSDGHNKAEVDNSGLFDLSQKVSKLNCINKELEREHGLSRSKLVDATSQNDSLRKTILELSEQLKLRETRDKKISDTQAAMLGRALNANEELAATANRQRLAETDALAGRRGAMRAVIAHAAAEHSEYSLMSGLAARRGLKEPRIGTQQTSELSTPKVTVPTPLPVSERAQVTCRTVSKTASLSSSLSDIEEYSSSPAYTYIEEEFSVSATENIKEAGPKGISVRPTGHGGLPFSLRAPEIIPRGRETPMLGVDMPQMLLASDMQQPNTLRSVQELAARALADAISSRRD